MLQIENLPENSYMLGGQVLAQVSSFKGLVLVHLRKYNFFKTTWYPTKEGVAMNESAFDRLIAVSYKIVYGWDYGTSPEDITISDEIKATVHPKERTVEIKKTRSFQDVTTQTSILLTRNQWDILIDKLNEIRLSKLGHNLNNQDLVSCYEEYITFTNPREPTAEENKQMMDCVHDAFCTLLEKKGELKVVSYCLKTNDHNSLEDFVSAIGSIRMYDFIDELESALTNAVCFAKKPRIHTLVSRDFLKSVNFLKVITEARRRLVAM